MRPCAIGGDIRVRPSSSVVESAIGCDVLAFGGGVVGVATVEVMLVACLV